MQKLCILKKYISFVTEVLLKLNSIRQCSYLQNADGKYLLTWPSLLSKNVFQCESEIRQAKVERIYFQQICTKRNEKRVFQGEGKLFLLEARIHTQE